MKGPEFSIKYEIENYLDYETSANLLLSKILNSEVSRETLQVPVSIFRQNLSGLRACVKYLHENQGLRFTDIALLLSRDQRTIWTEYQSAKDEPSFGRNILSDPVTVAVDALANRNLSFLESLAINLHSNGFSKVQIAGLIGKDQRTIWTIINRAESKMARFIPKGVGLK